MKLVTIKSFFVSAIILFSTTIYTYGQEIEVLMPYLKGELYGYANSKGKIIVEPKYEYAMLFENECARVRLNHKWGLIKQNGQIVFEPTAKNISMFDSNGLAKVNVDNKYGVINKKGEWIVPSEYSWLDIKSNFIVVANSMRQSALLDLNGKTIVDFKFNQFKFHEIPYLDSNLIITGLDEQYGLIEIQKKKYNIRITPHYQSLERISNEYFKAKQNDKLGLINSKDEIIVPFEYDNLIKEGHFFLAEQEVEYEVKIKTVELGEYVPRRRGDDIEKEYDEKNKVVYYLMTQVEQEELKLYGIDINESPHVRMLYSLINREGKFIIPAQFGEISTNKHFVQVKTDEGVTLFDKNGAPVSSLVFDRIDEVKEGLTMVRLRPEKNGIENLDGVDRTINYYNRFRFGFIDSSGKMVLPLIYNGAHGFNLNRTAVRKSDKWALINKKGDLITDFKYDQLYYAGEKRYGFRQGKLWGLLDLNGQEVIPAKYYGVVRTDYETDHFHGYSCLVFKNGKAITTKQLPGFRQTRTSLIDTNGIQLFPFKYKTIEEQEGGLFKVSLRNHDHERESYGLIDKNGTEIVPVYQNHISWLVNEKVYTVSGFGHEYKGFYCDQNGQETESPYKAIEREGFRDYRILSNGYYSAKKERKTVYFTPKGIPLFEE
jgi:hypothetical protein